MTNAATEATRARPCHIPGLLSFAAARLWVLDCSRLGATGVATTGDAVFLATTGAILAGAIFGDHCSPISDTTVLSSAAAGCDHFQHVATQLPYALLTAIASVLMGYLPIGFGIPWWICLPVATVVSIGGIVFLGRDSEQSES